MEHLSDPYRSALWHTSVCALMNSVTVPKGDASVVQHIQNYCLLLLQLFYVTFFVFFVNLLGNFIVF